MSDLFFEPVILGLAPWWAGRLLSEFAERERVQREYAALVEAQLEQQARLAARRQATEMARELHDDLGHRLSVIVLQASGARLMLKSAPDRSMAALGVIEEGCRDALAGLRLAGRDLRTRWAALWPDPGARPSAWDRRHRGPYLPAASHRPGRDLRGRGKVSGTGQGIIGMRERAALHRGTLTAAPADRGYVVQARFPLTQCTW